MKKLIILNGPPGAGKDTAAEEVARVFDIPHVKLSWPLKYIVSDTLGISHSVLEQNKERATVYELSYRQLQIEVFKAVSRVLSSKWLAAMAVTRVERNSIHDTFVFSDCGRQEEINVLCSAFGAENVLLIQLSRPGKDYSQDIRTNVVPAPNQPVKRINNTGTLDHFKHQVVLAVGNFLELDDV